MPRHELNYTIDDAHHQLIIYGTPRWGDDICIYDDEDIMVHSQAWAQDGYTIIPLFSAEEFDTLKNHITSLVKNRIPNTLSEFSLERYHEAVTEDAIHNTLIGQNNLSIPIHTLPCLDHIQSKLTALFNLPLTPINPYTTTGEFSIRLVRPFRLDHSPPHKDVWIGKLRRSINLYIPLAGSDENASLALMPQSHLWNESVFQYTQGGAYTEMHLSSVPGLLSIKNKRVVMIRPNPNYGQCLLFSPYMLHGGSSNRNPHTTRVSLEIRFWEKR